MVQEVVELLITNKDGFYIDATFGDGGHTQALLSHTSKDALILGIDRDPEAVERGLQRFAAEPKLIIKHGRFSSIDLVVDNIDREISGILMDVGISSCQLDDAERGFSFSVDGPLDMRMDKSTGEPVSAWLQKATLTELEKVLKEFGDEPHARSIAAAIIDYRKKYPITSTKQFAAIVVQAKPRSLAKRIHSATRSFQAVRIFINQEMQELQQGLTKAEEVLQPKGRLAVISFHSLEHRMVKSLTPKMKLIHKVKPSIEEVRANKRSRSSLLRVLEKAA